MRDCGKCLHQKKDWAKGASKASVRCRHAEADNRVKNVKERDELASSGEMFGVTRVCVYGGAGWM